MFNIIECCEIKLVSNPAADDLAQMYLFTHNKINYRLIRNDIVCVSADLEIRAADNTLLHNAQLTIYLKLLRALLRCNHYKLVLDLSINDFFNQMYRIFYC